jgi:hypothetical protein
MQGRKDLPEGTMVSSSVSSPAALASSSVDSTPGLGIGVGFASPVLARGWGNRIHLLQVCIDGVVAVFSWI